MADRTRIRQNDIRTEGSAIDDAVDPADHDATALIIADTVNAICAALARLKGTPIWETDPDGTLNALHAGLTNHLSDTANPHATDIENLGSGTLAELNDAVTDATLDDTSTHRTPTAHALSHCEGDTDELTVQDLGSGTAIADKIIKSDGIGGWLLADDQGTPLTNDDPQDVDKSAASAGIGTEATRSDHKHDIATGIPSDIGAGNVEGSAVSLARSDHIHSHAAQLGGALHATATPLVAGFLSSTDKVKLDGVGTLSDIDPVNVDKSAALEGLGTEAARQDHKHDIDTAIAGAVSSGDSAAEGVATSLARSDHTHSVVAPGAPVNVDRSAAQSGVSGNLARQDHKHDIDTAVPVATGIVNTEGVATQLARSDHIHQLSVHGSTHIRSGTDEIDGDKLDIDYAPTNYIPTITPPDVTSVDHLTAHLAGIDDRLGEPTMVNITDNAVAEGNNSITGFEDVVLVKRIRIETVSVNWSMTLFSKDDYTSDPLAVFENRIGDWELEIDIPYEDKDASQEFHYSFTDHNGTNTHDIEVWGVAL